MLYHTLPSVSSVVSGKIPVIFVVRVVDSAHGIVCRVLQSNVMDFQCLHGAPCLALSLRCAIPPPLFFEMFSVYSR